MNGFGDTRAALGMRKVVTRLSSLTLDRERPKYVYGTVTAIDRRNSKCTVQFADGTRIPMPLGGTIPAAVGQKVKIDGLPGDRMIVDVVGGGADAYPGDLKFTSNENLQTGYVRADGSVYSMDTYPDLAWARGYKDTYEAQVLQFSPSAYYKLDETSGTTLVDSSGNGRDGTFTGSPTLAQAGAITGETGTSVLFASGKYASRASGSSPWGASTVDNRYVGGWVYVPTASEKGTFFGTNGISLGVGDVDMTANGNHLIGAFASVRWIPTGVNIGTGWHRVAISYNAGVTYIYLDGVLVFSDTSGVSNPLAVANLTTIGVRESVLTEPWAGRVDEVVFVNRFVYPTENKKLYLRGLRNFDVADMRGRVPVGQGGVAAGRLTGVSVDGPDWAGGEENHLLLSTESGNPALAHSGGTATVAAQNSSVAGTGRLMRSNNTGGVQNDLAAPVTGIANHAAANASASHNNMQPYEVEYWIVKT